MREVIRRGGGWDENCEWAKGTRWRALGKPSLAAVTVASPREKGLTVRPRRWHNQSEQCKTAERIDWVDKWMKKSRLDEGKPGERRRNLTEQKGEKRVSDQAQFSSSVRAGRASDATATRLTSFALLIR